MKLFNGVRFDLVKGKRLKNYLVYAIGEIVLVVIGILIALWLNNYSKVQQLAEGNTLLQQKVLTQLDVDLETLNAFKADLDTLNNVYLKTLDRDYAKTKVPNGGSISTILFEVKVVRLDNHIIDWIDNAELENSEASEQLVQLSSSYKQYLKYIADTEAIIFKKLTANLEFMEITQPWYTELITDFKCGNACIKYVLYDEGHKARIASLRFLYTEKYGSIIDGFYDDLIRSKKSIANSIISL